MARATCEPARSSGPSHAFGQEQPTTSSCTACHLFSAADRPPGLIPDGRPPGSAPPTTSLARDPDAHLSRLRGVRKAGDATELEVTGLPSKRRLCAMPGWANWPTLALARSRLALDQASPNAVQAPVASSSRSCTSCGAPTQHLRLTWLRPAHRLPVGNLSASMAEPTCSTWLVVGQFPFQRLGTASRPAQNLSERAVQHHLEQTSDAAFRPTSPHVPHLTSIAELDVGGAADRHPADRGPVDLVGPKASHAPIGCDSEFGHRAPSRSRCPACIRQRVSGLSCWWSI